MLKSFCSFIGLIFVSSGWGVLDSPTASNFTDLKKADFSIRVKSRCLLQPKAAEALIQVQKIFQITGEGLVMRSCYRPEVPYCTGGTVWLDLVDREEASVLRTRSSQLYREMKKAGYEAVAHQAGKFTFEASKNWPCLAVPLDQIP